MKRLSIFIIAILTLFTVNLFGQIPKDQIQKIVASYIQPNSPGIAIIVTEGDKVLFKSAYGLSDITNSDRLDADHLFRIGSITKQFTAIAILKLVHDDKIRLDAPINEYIPGVNMTENITVMQLLNHTSGLGNQSDVPSFDEETMKIEDYPNTIMGSILNSQLKFSPGTGYSYSNLGYIVLGNIIERVSGLSYEDYLKIYLLTPLNLQDTGFEYLDDSQSLMSKGHSLVGMDYKYAPAINMKIPYAAGGLVSSLGDLSKWNNAVMSGQVIPLSYINRLSESNTLPSGEVLGYSMGWQNGNIQEFKSLKHDGIVNGYTSMAIYVPKKDIFIAVLSNCDCYRDIENTASKIAAVALGTPYPSEGISVSQKTLEEHQGHYRNQTNEIKVALHDDVLKYYRKGGEKTELIPTSENKFIAKGSLDQIEFSTSENKKSYTIVTLNQTSSWERTEQTSAYKTMPLSNTDLDEYTGKYQVPNKFVFEILRIDDAIYGQLGNDRKEIFCYDTDKFCAKNTDALLLFSRDDRGQINQVSVSQGIEFSATKLK